MTARKPVRTMKARRNGTLSCGHYVLVGALIVKAGAGWICSSCRLAELDDLARLARTPPRPSGRGDHETKEMSA